MNFTLLGVLNIDSSMKIILQRFLSIDQPMVFSFQSFSNTNLVSECHHRREKETRTILRAKDGTRWSFGLAAGADGAS